MTERNPEALKIYLLSFHKSIRDIAYIRPATRASRQHSKEVTTPESWRSESFCRSAFVYAPLLYRGAGIQSWKMKNSEKYCFTKAKIHAKIWVEKYIFWFF